MIKLYATAQVPGIHHWPNAAEYTPHFYLQYPHRHIFHIKVTIQVSAYNREIDFLILKSMIYSILQQAFSYNPKTKEYDFETKSCEQLALYLLKEIPHSLEVEVSEDGENGSIVTHD